MKNSLQSVLSLFICIFTLLALSEAQAATDGKNSLIAAEAYIDNHQLTTPLAIDDVLAYGFSSASGNMDLSSLEGMHTLYIRMQDDAGLWSHPIGQIINVSINGQRPGKGHHNELTQAEYFYDEDPGEGNGILINVPEDGTFNQSIERLITGVSLENLPPGTHTFFLRFKDTNNNWSVAIGQSIQIDNSGFAGATSVDGKFAFKEAEAYFDTDPGLGAGLSMLNVETGEVATNGAAVRALVDVAQLTEGIHTLYIRYQNQSGVWSKSIGQSIYIGEQFTNNNITAGTATIASADYAIDGGTFQTAPLADGVAGGLTEKVDFSRPVSLAAYHSAEVRFTDSKGRKSRRFKPDTYTPNDLDWDGLPDAWEMAHFGNLESTGHDDPDGDGLTNAQEFYRGTDPLVRDNPDTPLLNNITITNVFMTEGGNNGKAFTFNAVLSAPLPEGYGVFLNFDDLRGHWFIQDTDGGHVQLTDNTGSQYSLNRDLDKLGLRTFRAGIFKTQNDQDRANDQLIGQWSNKYTCTLDLCLSTVVRYDDVGNPALHGSQLFKQVDVASGNYHFVVTDMSVPAIGPDFSMSRAYNSMGTTRDGSPAPWSFSYEMKASFTGNGAAQELVIGPREDGRLQYFFKDFVTDKWTALNPGNFDQIEQNADGSIVLYTQGNRVYYFADPEGTEAGRLQSIKDRLGNALSFSYDANNNLIGATDANAKSYTISRNAENRIAKVTDFTGRFVEYSYDSHGMITSVRNVRGGQEQYTYAGTTGNDIYRLATLSDPRDSLRNPVTFQLAITYDSNGRVAKITDGIGNDTDFLYGYAYTGGPLATGIKQPPVDGINHNRVYVVDDKRTRVEEMLDAVTYGAAFKTTDVRTKQEYLAIASRQQLAEKSLVTRVTDPNKGTTKIDYSETAKGKPTKVTDAKNRSSSATYTSIEGQVNLTPVATTQQAGVATATQYQQFTNTGRAKIVTDPRGNSSTREFSGPAGSLTKSTNPRLYSTHYSYDALGNVKTTTDAKGAQTVRIYDELGRVTKETSPLGLETSYTYDEHGNVLTQREQATGINYLTQYEYDASDNLIKTTDPKGHVTNYVYDVLNRKIEENYLVNSILHTRHYTYDAMGRLASVTNERAQTSQTHYDARSQVKSKVNALGDTTVSYSYDLNGNVIKVTDGEQRTITTKYDKLNRKIQVTDDKNQSEYWTYNPAGQVKTHTDSRGVVTAYEYDAIGNMTKMFYPNHPELGFTQSVYDKNSNVIEVYDANGHKTSYSYDELDRRISTTLQDGQKWQYTYDANGNQLTEITPTGEKTQQVYDALNRVKQLTEYAADNSVTRQISYEYDANSNITQISSGGNTISYSYDALNRVSSITDVYGKTIHYAYDKAGNRTGLTYPGNKTIHYVYDNADRLTSLTDWLNKTTTYHRNKTGQVKEVINGNGTKAEYIYDAVGRMISLKNIKANGSEISRHDLTLDKAGNITQATANLPLIPTLPQSITSMSYDNNNRLQSADGNTYTHDPSGRIIKEDKNGTQTIYNFDINDHISSITRNGTTLSSYAYDLNDNRIKQVQNGVETRYVIDPLAALPNVVAETDASGVIDRYYIYGEGLVSQIDAAGNSHYYHFDPTGHTLALTDASGNVTDKYAYAPYGFTTVDGATPNPFKYVGRYGVMDDGNGLHYMRARYYSEEIKRFVSLDGLHGDMVNAQALNRYAYVLGNPVMGVDASGLAYSDEKQTVIDQAAEKYVTTSVDKVLSATINNNTITIKTYSVARYTEEQGKSFTGKITLLATAYFTITDTYKACKDSKPNNISRECVTTVTSKFYSNMVGGAATWACGVVTGGTTAIMCGYFASKLGGGIAEGVFGALYDYSFQLGKGVHKIKMLSISVVETGVKTGYNVTNSIVETGVKTGYNITNYWRGYGSYIYRCGLFGGKC